MFFAKVTSVDINLIWVSIVGILNLTIEAISKRDNDIVSLHIVFPTVSQRNIK